MEISPGILCFVSDEFFMKVNDPYLKINYDETKRPHYFVIKDLLTELYTTFRAELSDLLTIYGHRIK